MAMQPNLIDHILEWCQANLPAHMTADVLTGTSSDVPPGTVKIRCTLPSPRPAAPAVIDALPPSKRWNAGERDLDVTRPLYMAGHIEPHVTWASDLGWRVTSEGKKAGLK
jgi:hypothetical protein